MKEEKKIMYESPEAATFMTNLSGWVDINGRYWGKDEHMARYSSCTHRLCDCGGEMTKSWTKCEACRARSSREAYFKMPQKEWDLVTPLVLYNDDKYFRNEEELKEYCSEEQINGQDLMLCLCDYQPIPQVDYDIWTDIMPEDDGLEDVYPELAARVDELNKFIETLKPQTYSQGKYRTSYNYTPENQ